jgi:hypothetical protein
MKQFLLLLSVFSVLPVLSARAQDAKASPNLAAPPSAQKPKEEMNITLTPSKPQTKIPGTSAFAGGYFMELVRAERKRALFDLRTPLDPEKDLENLVFYPGTERVQAFVLFRIKF